MRIGDLCSGVGTLGAVAEELTGGTVAWHAETEPAACRVLEAHWPGVPNLGDLTAVDWSSVEPVDVLTAGYPCQPFSHAGRRQGADDDRHLWPHIRDAIGALRPRLVLLENVAGHLTLGAASVVADLAALGYVGSWTTLRASEVGACHRRERWFCAARPADADVSGLALGAPSGGGVERDAGGHPPPVGGNPLLPTPSVADATGGHLTRGGDCSDELLLPGVVKTLLPTPTTEPNTGNGHARNLSRESMRWGSYAAAIARHEAVLGRPAPPPTEPSPKTDKPRLSPLFVEFMMMLPEGWVTGVEGVSRNAQLKMLGNGCVPLQCITAYRHLLEGMA